MKTNLLDAPLLEAPGVSPARRVVGRRPTTVLLAEDDNDLRQLLATALREDGYHVTEAKDGDELLAQVERAAERTRGDNFAVIVSDVRMPGFWGTDVLAVLSCSRRTTPFILMTAFGDAALHAEAKELGATVVLNKPVDLDTLRSAVWWAMDPR